MSLPAHWISLLSSKEPPNVLIVKEILPFSMSTRKSASIALKEPLLIAVFINVLKKLWNVKEENNMIPIQKNVYVHLAHLSMMEKNACHAICLNIGMKVKNPAKIAQMDPYTILFKPNVKHARQKLQW